VFHKIAGRAVIEMNGRLDTVAYHEAADPLNFYGNLEVDPGFVDAAAGDYRLTPTSPLVDRGAWLTRTRSAGSGKAIPVEDAAFFIGALDYGMESVLGDTIELQGGGKARVTHVDYNNWVLYLDRALTWTSGQNLSLSFRGAAPDIGAIEY
jgi:hypothetical protein